MPKTAAQFRLSLVQSGYPCAKKAAATHHFGGFPGSWEPRENSQRGNYENILLNPFADVLGGIRVAGVLGRYWGTQIPFLSLSRG